MVSLERAIRLPDSVSMKIAASHENLQIVRVGSRTRKRVSGILPSRIKDWLEISIRTSKDICPQYAVLTTRCVDHSTSSR